MTRTTSYVPITDPSVFWVHCPSCGAPPRIPCRRFGAKSGPYCETHVRRMRAYLNNLEGLRAAHGAENFPRYGELKSSARLRRDGI